MTSVQPSAEPSSALSTDDLDNEGDRISVTDVNGTVARFEMAYSPTGSDRFRFGPPIRQLIPSIIFVALAIGLLVAVLVGQASGSASKLGQWVADQDRGRPIGSLGLGIIIVVSAFGTVARAMMRGMVVRADGVEARYLLALGVPRIRKWAWPQVERIIVDDRSIMFELWDGQYERLPDVKDHQGLCDLLERIASGRKIRVTKLPRVAGG